MILMLLNLVNSFTISLIFSYFFKRYIVDPLKSRKRSFGNVFD